MDIRSFVSLTLLIAWFCLSWAKIIQQQAEIKFFDTEYVSEATAFTSRRKRGDPYLTNITVVTLQPLNNNINIKVVADIRTVGSIVFHEMKLCDGYKLPWIKVMRDAYSNFTDCPITPGTYKIYNLELPPKNFPLPIPKGEGTLHLYVLKSGTSKLLFHGLMKVTSL